MVASVEAVGFRRVEEGLPLLPVGGELDRARAAIAEYCRTGQRPTCVQWQPGQWY
nr:Imm1 family immunity protein [Actinopolyspora sp. BKK2]